MTTSTHFAALHAHSYFSLLDGASSPEAMVAQAQALGLRALALTDHDTLAGAVRFWTAARKAGLQPIIGAEITLDRPLPEDQGAAAGSAHLTLLAETQQGYGNLCQLLTQAHVRPPLVHEPAAAGVDASWPGKTAPLTTWDDLRAHAAGLIALSGCRRGPVASAVLSGRMDDAARAARALREIFGPRNFFVELQHHGVPDDDRLVRGLAALAASSQLPCVATDDAHYATREVSRLRDCLIAIAHNETLAEARRNGHLPLNSNYALAAPEEMCARFGAIPGALRNTLAIAERCGVSLDFSHRRLPAFGVPADRPNARTEFEYLYALCNEALPWRYSPFTPDVLKQLTHELAVIERNGLAAFFLVMWDIVRFARANGIRCQGRGSAAGSIMAYLLGITSIDPIRHNLLFERFLSDDGHTMPDIDVDFATDRREEVIQYVYRKYGADHVAMVCNHVTFQARSALRDLGKVLGFPQATIDRLAKSIDAHTPGDAAEEIEDQFKIQNSKSGIHAHPLKQLASLLRQIDGCPRHLGIHSGGMLITGPRLSEIVPLRRATMPGRVVCEWDKDSVEDAGLVKADLLGLRMLSAVSEAAEIVRPRDAQMDGRADAGSHEQDWLDALPLDDPAIYDMLQRADTLGTFQVESRAQQQMLPRLRPARFEDIIVEVAIVRPGPIQGGMVHPYLRRHAGEEPAAYLHPCLEPVLRETLGVILFQEQAIRVAVAAAGFSPGEADKLRRAMSRARSSEAMAEMAGRFLEGALKNGIDLDTAKAIFKQLAGFAGFGFCKSHAASFALIAYQTLWLKRYHPAAFYCGVLNHRPGFYSEEVIVGDARRHGVNLLPIDVNRSAWGYTLDDGDLRMGLRALTGLGEIGYRRIDAARVQGRFSSLRDLCERTRLPQALISDLVRAGACDGLGPDRRRMLWELGEIVYVPDELPLDMPVSQADLPGLGELEQMTWEYELTGLSASGQYMQHYRPALQRVGAVSAAEVKQMPSGRRVRVAGMQVIRQRPETAKGMTFISLEDETGLVDLIVRPDTYERFKPLIKGETVLLVDGVVQQANGATSLLVTTASAPPQLAQM